MNPNRLQRTIGRALIAGVLLLPLPVYADKIEDLLAVFKSGPLWTDGSVQAGGPNCIGGIVPRHDLTIMGDSRAWNIVGDATGNSYIPIAQNFSRKQILESGQINTIHNAGWPGAGTYDWIMHIRGCNDQGFLLKFAVNSPTILHLGGIDILRRYEELEEIEAFYRWLFDLMDFFRNPAEALGRIISGKKNKYVELWWIWQLEAQLNVTSYNMTRILTYLTYEQNAKVMLATPAAAYATCRGSPIDGHCPDTDGSKAFRLFLTFLRYHDKLISEVYPNFAGLQNGNQVAYQDMFFTTLGLQYYETDLIHLNVNGNVNWGKQLAIALGRKGWFHFNGDVGPINNYEQIIDAKAAAVGIPFEELLGTSVSETLASDAYHPGGWRKEILNYPSIFIRNDRSVAYAVQGNILQTYNGLAGPGGFLGFPTSDEECAGFFCIDRRSFFDCGYIQWSPFFGQWTGGLGGCPALNGAQQALNPNFSTCTDASCGAPGLKNT